MQFHRISALCQGSIFEEQIHEGTFSRDMKGAPKSGVKIRSTRASSPVNKQEGGTACTYDNDISSVTTNSEGGTAAGPATIVLQSCRQRPVCKSLSEIAVVVKPP